MEEEPKMNKIRILVVEPNKEPYIMKVKNNLKDLQNIVRGLIEVVRLEHNVILVCNEEGKLLSLRFNRIITNDIIVGTFFIVGECDGDFISLSRKQIHKYKKKFSLSKHEKFIKFIRQNMNNSKFLSDMRLYGLEGALRRNVS